MAQVNGAALATPFSRFERLMYESPRLCRGMVTNAEDTAYPMLTFWVLKEIEV